MKRLIIALAVLTAISTSCYYESEESLYPDLGSCDTIVVTYSGNIIPILDYNCLSCHAENVAAEYGAGLNLQGYANVFENRTLISSAINHSGTVTSMPKDASKLNDCLISQFDIWVGDGAPDN